jgi:hypothetical protein
MKRLALKISKELSILPENRVTDGQAFLADCFAEFNTALEQGNPVEKELVNHLAFTPVPKKEKYSFMNLVSLGDSSSRGSYEHSQEPRAKKLWNLADRVQRAANSPRGLLTHFHQSDSTPGARLQKNRM